MAQQAFQFVTRGHCIGQRKISLVALNSTTCLNCNFNAMTLFTFYKVPSSGKLEGTLVHSCGELNLPIL